MGRLIMSGETVSIELKLPRKTYEKVLEKAREAGFNDINEFLEFVLEQLIEEEEETPVFSKEDEEKIKERLRSLGYL